MVETPPAREVLVESRTLKGGGAAGVETIGAAGVEVAQEVLAETQGAILPLVPYLDTLRWCSSRWPWQESPRRSTRGSTIAAEPAMITRCVSIRRALAFYAAAVVLQRFFLGGRVHLGDGGDDNYRPQLYLV